MKLFGDMFNFWILKVLKTIFIIIADKLIKPAIRTMVDETQRQIQGIINIFSTMDLTSESAEFDWNKFLAEIDIFFKIAVIVTAIMMIGEIILTVITGGAETIAAQGSKLLIETMSGVLYSVLIGSILTGQAKQFSNLINNEKFEEPLEQQLAGMGFGTIIISKMVNIIENLIKHAKSGPMRNMRLAASEWALSIGLISILLSVVSFFKDMGTETIYYDIMAIVLAVLGLVLYFFTGTFAEEEYKRAGAPYTDFTKLIVLGLGLGAAIVNSIIHMAQGKYTEVK